ncbi:MAG: glycosyltransferase family 4 protein [Betaproteobacteria bacterium]|nr:glycosyltransferase family 4 protein [Betaproteobacteria bacterium]
MHITGHIHQTVLLLGPALTAVSGVSTHLNQLLRTDLAQHFRLLHFQVGSEGRYESSLRKLWRLLVSPWQLAKTIRRYQHPIVHINTSMNAKAFWRDLAYLIVSRSCGCKVVYQVHGGDLPLDFTPDNELLRRLLRKVFRLPSVIVLLGEFQRTAYHAFSPDVELKVAPNAIEVDNLVGSTADIDADRPLRLVFMGRLAEVKGVFEAVEAVSLLRDEGVDVKLAIAGSGPDQQRLEQRIAELGIADRVTMKGSVFGPEKDALWLESEVFVFPTYHREGLPYALLESMVARTVPVTCEVGAIPEVMRDHREGLFVPPHDPRALASSIKWLHEHRDQLTQYGDAARERVLSNHTLPRLGNRFLEIYENLGVTSVPAGAQ